MQFCSSQLWIQKMSTSSQNEARFFTDFYDSVKQRMYPNVFHNLESTKSAYIGRLRLDTLMSRKLVLTDAQILDGAFFLRIGPGDLINYVTRETNSLPPIEIKARRPKLDESLLSFFKKPGSETLRGFSFSSVESEKYRSNIQSVLEQTKADDIKSWRDIPKVLKNSEIDLSYIEMLESQWAKWIEATSGFTKDFVVVWKGEYNLEKYLQLNSLLPILETQRGRSLAGWAYKNRHDRSKVDQRLTQIKTNQDEALLSDIFSIEAWFNQAYNLTISEQHGCKNFESISGSFKYQLESLHLLDQSTPNLNIGVPEDFIVKLGELPNDLFRSLFQSQKESFNQWWYERDIESLKRGILPFVEEVETVREFPTLDILKRVIATGVGVSIGDYLGRPIVGAIVGATLGGVVNFYIIDQIYDKYLSRENRIVKRIVKTAESRL